MGFKVLKLAELALHDVVRHHHNITQCRPFHLSPYVVWRCGITLTAKLCVEQLKESD